MHPLPLKKRPVKTCEQEQPLDLSTRGHGSLESVISPRSSPSLPGSSRSSPNPPCNSPSSPIPSCSSGSSSVIICSSESSSSTDSSPASFCCPMDTISACSSPTLSIDNPRAPLVVTPNNGTNEQLYACRECPSWFTTVSRLRAHLRRHRIKSSRRYQCDECNKCFVQQSSLITHRRIHTGERPYKCEVCANSYGDLSTFTKHKRTHTGERPYGCHLCIRKFSQSGNCLRHLRSVHRVKA